MSKLSGAIGALQGLEKGMVGRDQAMGQLAQTLFDLRKYQETTLPESQAQVAESTERSRMYAAQTESEIPRRQNLLVDLELNTMKRDQAKKQIDVYKKYAEKYGIDLSVEPLLKDAIATMQEAEERILKAQGDIRTETKSQELGVPEVKATESFETARQKIAEAITGTKTEEAFQQPTAPGGLTGPQLRGRALQVKAETEIALGPVSVEQSKQELLQTQATTPWTQADMKSRIAMLPYTEKLLQEQVRQLNIANNLKETYGAKEAAANINNLELRNRELKNAIKMFDSTFYDKELLDEMVWTADPSLINPLTKRRMSNWEEFKFIAPLIFDEKMATLRATAEGRPKTFSPEQMLTNIAINKNTLFGGPIPHKSPVMVRNFIQNIPTILNANADPYDIWNMAKSLYGSGLSGFSAEDLYGYLEEDKIISPDQIAQVTIAIQQALAQQARTSAAGGTPTTQGTTPQGAREQVAGGSITESQDTTFGLDSATRIRIAGIIDVNINASDLRERLIKEIAKEKDMNKRNQMSLFAEHYFETKR